MNDTTCPRCDVEMEILQSGTRASGTTDWRGGKLAEHGIPTIAKCPSCEQRWQREWGDQGAWERFEGFS